MPGTTSAIVGRKSTFIIRKAIKVKPPKPIDPPNKKKFPLSLAQKNGVTLVWQDANGAEKYKIKITKSGKQLVNKEVLDSIFKLNTLSPGKYKWSLQTLGEGISKSKWGKSRSFEILKLSKISWVTKSNQTIFYSGNTPTASVKWKRSKAKKWKIRFATSSSGLERASWIKKSSPSAKIKLSGENTYFFEVHGLNKAGTLVSKSKTLSQTFELER